jgi:mono/diheme cytochrome c family protein
MRRGLDRAGRSAITPAAVMLLRRVRVSCLVVMAVGALSACDPSPVPVAAAGGAASSSGGVRPRRAANDPPELVQAGRERFEIACARCHGPDAPGGALDDRDVTNERLEASLHAGSDDGGLIPAVAPADLRDEHLPALRAYLRSVGALRVE